MNPLAKDAIISILTKVLAGASVYLVTHGYWTTEAAANYVAGAASGLLSLGISLYNVYGDRLKLVTALASGKMTEKHLDEKITETPSALLPSTTTPKNEQP